MYPLFETIRISDGAIDHLRWHEERMVRSRKELWDIDAPVHLTKIIAVPEKFHNGIVRCNIQYGPGSGPVLFQPFIKTPVRNLKLIECDYIDYHLKYQDRLLLNELLSKKEDCDEIIIVKDGLITDTSMSNLIFFDGSLWFTPEKPLLKGTCRQRLLEEKKISEMEIRVETLDMFHGLKIINAMRDPDEEEMIAIGKIKR